MRRIVRVAVSPQMLPWSLEEGKREAYSVTEGLPRGANYVGSSMDATTLTVWLFFEHESFEEVEDAGLVPERKVSFFRETIRESVPA